MTFTAQNKKTDFEHPPEGTQIGRCFRLIDLGTQFSRYWGNAKRKILIVWELPECAMKDGRPFSASKRYTLSFMENSTLRQDLQSWRGRVYTEQEIPFDVQKILGHACLLNITRNGDYSNIMAIMALQKNIQCPPQINPTLVFDLDNFNQQIFDSLSDGLKTTIALSPEYQKLFAAAYQPPRAPVINRPLAPPPLLPIAAPSTFKPVGTLANQYPGALMRPSVQPPSDFSGEAGDDIPW